MREDINEERSQHDSETEGIDLNNLSTNNLSRIDQGQKESPNKTMYFTNQEDIILEQMENVEEDYISQGNNRKPR